MLSALAGVPVGQFEYLPALLEDEMTPAQLARLNEWISRKRGEWQCCGYCKYAFGNDDPATHDKECVMDYSRWENAGRLLEEMAEDGKHLTLFGSKATDFGCQIDDAGYNGDEDRAYTNSGASMTEAIALSWAAKHGYWDDMGANGGV